MTYPALITTFGILIFIAAFLGCFGSLKNSVCLLTVSCVIISILMVCEIVIATLIFVYQGTFVTVIGEALKYEIQNPQNATIDRESIYNLQKNFECCGGTGPSDWDGKIPASCCANGKSNCQSPYQIGCAQAMNNFIRGPFIGVASSILVISLIQLCGVVCIACLASKVGDYEKV
ncbi:unnamed protein product [Hymenolepis diminuta]|nr:unnamed protein product [Hymenolepis diminuta]